MSEKSRTEQVKEDLVKQRNQLMSEKSMIEQVKEALVKQSIMDVESFRTTLAEKILLADVRSRGARHVSMAHAAVQHADALMALLSQSKKATDK